MRRILLAGFSEAITPALAESFPDLLVERRGSRAEVEQAIAGGRWDLVLIDQGAADDIGEVIAHGRASLGLGATPVIACLARDVDRRLVTRLVRDLGVSQILLHPLALDELCHHVADILGLPAGAARRTVAAQAEVATTFDAMRATFVAAVDKRVDAIAAAAHDLLRGDLADEVRAKAAREAHKLHGSLGTFGYAEGSRLAGAIDRIFQVAGPLTAAHGREISEHLVALKQEVGASPLSPAPSASGPVVAAAEGHVLVVDDDDHLADLLLAEGRARGLDIERAASPAAARARIAARRPAVVLLDLSFEGGEDGLALLAELTTRAADIRVVVMTSRGQLADRLDVMRLGANLFVCKPLAAPAIIDTAANLLARRTRETASLLAVDDDPLILVAIRALLEPRGINVATLADPLGFWQALEEAKPDLLVLDFDMPFLNGIELCRVVRNDARWSTLPILFLTARTDTETIHRIYAAGADDYVPKPIVGPELVTRIANRLERIRLLARMAELGGSAHADGALPFKR